MYMYMYLFQGYFHKVLPPFLFRESKEANKWPWNHFGISDVWHRRSHLPSPLSVGLLSLFFTIMKLFSFSVPLQAYFSSCVSSSLLSSPVACGFSEPHCQLRKCSHCLRLHSCMQEPSVTPTCLGAHWGGWEEDLRGRQPPSQWALGRQWCLLALRRITGCRQLTLPPFRHLGEAWGECLRQGPLGMPLAKHPFH